MIESFRLKNFKNFEDVTLNIDYVNIIVGSNASGKSNLIEGIKYLALRANGLSPEDAYKEVRGSVEYACRFGMDSFSISCHNTSDFDDSCYFEIQVEDFMPAKLDSSIITYRLYRDEDNPQLIYASKAGEDTAKRFDGIHIDQKSPKSIIFADQNEYLQLFNKLIFLDTIPLKMRNYVSINDDKLKANGENLSSVLRSICTDKEIKQQILNIVRTLPENEIEDITFSETDLGDVMLVLKERYGDRIQKVPAKVLSDGTLRCLTILAALYSQDENSLLIVEEFDNGIHPNRARTLIEKIAEIAKKRNISILMTTHNTAVLNALGKEMLAGVSVCYRNKEGNADLISLTDIPNYLDLLAQGEFGDLLAEDKVSAFIKHPKKNTKNIDWLVN